MSGHSKWSTIKRQKGVADIKRGLTFTKVANALTIAAKFGGSGDPETNPRLRMVIEEAKSVNMPKENVQRAIDRGLGKLPGQTLEEVVYEGFGPFKAAFIIEAVTDNKLRTLQILKNLFEKNGGSLGGSGSAAYMFSQKGEIKVASKGGNPDEELLELIDCGADDVASLQQGYLVYTEGTKVAEVSNKITLAGYKVESQELVMKPTVIIKFDNKEKIQKLLEFTEKLEELDDVQKVFANFEIVGEEV